MAGNGEEFEEDVEQELDQSDCIDKRKRFFSKERKCEVSQLRWQRVIWKASSNICTPFFPLAPRSPPAQCAA